MKLITKPIKRYDEIKLLVGKKMPSFLDMFRTDEEKEARRLRGARTITFPGRRIIDNIIIEDDSDFFIIGEKHQEIRIDSFILYGLIVISKEDNLYECCVDNYDEIKEGDKDNDK